MAHLIPSLKLLQISVTIVNSGCMNNNRGFLFHPVNKSCIRSFWFGTVLLSC